jgi:dipeptidyl-peptidase-3
MKILNLSLALLVGFSAACSPAADPGQPLEFQYQGDRFADLQILRYRVPGFEELTAKQRELLYYLYQAALSGRDIIWDQNYRHNLYLRRTLENIFATYRGNRNNQHWEQFMVYTKRVWFSSGIHHHYSTLKILPEFSREYFGGLAKDSDQASFPLQGSETVDDLLAKTYWTSSLRSCSIPM